MSQYLAIRERLEKSKVALLAVSKKQSIDKVEALYQEGQRDFGENYVQELVEKAKVFSEKGVVDIRWHFIGHLQKNKVKSLLPWVTTIAAVDSFELAEEISRRSLQLAHRKPVQILIQVNIDDEKTKSGFLPADVPFVAKKVSELPGLSLLGLMVIPDPSQGRSSFARTRELELRCRPYTKGELSMGMSSDYLEAIEEGSTQVRIGTALFGEREK